VIAGILYFQQTNSTLKPELKDFAVEDTASVSKIFMVNKLNEQVLLEKRNDQWYVNDKYPARKDAIDMLLKTFKRIDVKAPVSKSAFNTVVKNLAANNVKVEVYTNDEKAEKIFYVGGPTQDYYGTYMMLENSSTPFIMHIPGFSGYLSSRFFLNEDEWRDQTICRNRFEEISSVSITNFRNTGQSFHAVNLGNNKFDLIDLAKNQSVASFDTVMLKQYLAQYKKLSFERFATEVSRERTDSILSTPAIYKIAIENKINGSTEILAFLRPSTSEDPADREQYPYDLERMYGKINNDSNLVIIQYFTFDPLFADLKMFLR